MAKSDRGKTERHGLKRLLPPWGRKQAQVEEKGRVRSAVEHAGARGRQALEGMRERVPSGEKLRDGAGKARAWTADKLGEHAVAIGLTTLAVGVAGAALMPVSDRERRLLSAATGKVKQAGQALREGQVGFSRDQLPSISVPSKRSARASEDEGDSGADEQEDRQQDRNERRPPDDERSAASTPDSDDDSSSAQRDRRRSSGRRAADGEASAKSKETSGGQEASGESAKPSAAKRAATRRPAPKKAASASRRAKEHAPKSGAKASSASRGAKASSASRGAKDHAPATRGKGRSGGAKSGAASGRGAAAKKRTTARAHK